MATIKFSKKKAHQIYRLKDGTRVPGGSTICQYGEPYQTLLDWYYRMGVDGLDPKAHMEEAGAIGTVAHAMVQCHFNGDTGDFSEFSADEIEMGTKLYEKFLRVWDEQGLEFVASEVELWSEKYGYGGTLDIIARRKATEALVLADIKTSPQIYAKNLIQLALYEWLWNENNTEKIVDRVIIRLDKKSPTKTDVRWLGNLDDYFAHGLNQLACYNSRKKL